MYAYVSGAEFPEVTRQRHPARAAKPRRPHQRYVPPNSWTRREHVCEPTGVSAKRQRNVRERVTTRHPRTFRRTPRELCKRRVQSRPTILLFAFHFAVESSTRCRFHLAVVSSSTLRVFNLDYSTSSKTA